MNTKTKRIVVILSFIILLLGIYAAIKNGMYYNKEQYLYNMLPNPYINTLNQTVFLTLLSIYGLILGYSFKGILKKEYAIFMAPVLAITLWMVSGQFILSLGLIYNTYTTVAIMLIILILVLVIRKPKLKYEINKEFLIIIFSYFAISLFLCSIDFTLFMTDSYFYVILGQSLAKNGQLLPHLSDIYSARSLITSLMFTSSEFFGFSFENGLYTMYGLSFNLLICYFVFEELKKKLSTKLSLIITGLTLILLMTATNYSLIMFLNPYSNSIATVSLFLAVFFAYKSIGGESKLLIFSVLFMITFILVRSESIMIALIIIFFISNLDIKKKYVIQYEIVCFAALLFWYITFFRVAGVNFDEGKFLTISRASAIAAVFLMFILYTIFVYRLKFYDKIKKSLDWLPFIGMILVIVAFAFVNPSKVSTNLYMIYTNVTTQGQWGITIVISFGLLSILYLLSNKIDIWDKSLFAYIISLIFIFLFRESDLRLGRTDSANRMLITVIPFIAYIVATRIPIVLFSKDTVQKNDKVLKD